MGIQTGEKLRMIRKEKNLKKSDLAFRIHVTREDIDLWEEGEAEPSQEQWEALASALDTDMDTLRFCEEPEEERSYFKDKERRERAEKESKHLINKANYPVFITFLYMCMGIFGNLWHPGWLLFLTIPIYYLPDKHKTPRRLLTSPVVITLIYLILGFYFHLWHPGWLIFFAIPLLNTWFK